MNLNLSFRAKLLALGSATLIAALGAMAIAHDQFMARVLERQLMTYVDTTAPFLSAALATPLAARDYASIQAIMEESVQTRGFTHQVLVDAAGMVISASGWDVARQGLPLPTGKPVIVPSGEEVLFFVLPIHFADHALGTLYFGLSCEPLVDARLSMLGWSLIILSASLLVAAAFLEFGQRWLMRPLTLLHDASERIRHGFYEIDLQIKDRHEIGHLAEAVNLMAREIKKRVTELIDSESRQRNMLEQARIRGAELDEARHSAEAATRAKSEFLAVMSHELRTPLVAVVGAVDLLAGTTLDPNQRRLADIALGSASQLTDLIGNILDISRMENGMVALTSMPFNLDDTLDAVMQTAELRAANKDVRVVLAVEAGLARRRFGDPMRLRQVLVNLMVNAVKFTEMGTVQLQARPAAEADMVMFRVVDTGVGIAADQQAGIFDKFVQVDQSSTRKFEGAGLGLAICRDLVSAMGGRIGVESELGKGSTFWFTAKLPVEATT